MFVYVRNSSLPLLLSLFSFSKTLCFTLGLDLGGRRRGLSARAERLDSGGRGQGDVAICRLDVETLKLKIKESKSKNI